MAEFGTFLQGGAYNATDMREMLAGLLAKGSTGKTLPGVLYGNGSDGAVTQTPTASMSVNVAPFAAVVPDSGYGAYLGGLDAVGTIPIGASSGSQDRVDRVCWRPIDGAGTTSDGRSTMTSVTLPWGGSATKQTIPSEVYIVPGTPASSGATAPATPAGSVSLATVFVGRGVSVITTANLTRATTWTATAGGVVPISGAAVGQTVTVPPGRLVYDPVSDRVLQVGAGSVLRGLQPIEQTGTYSGSTDASGFITFAHSMGVAPLFVVATPTGQSTGALNSICLPAQQWATSATTITMRARRGDGDYLISNPYSCSWYAHA